MAGDAPDSPPLSEGERVWKLNNPLMTTWPTLRRPLRDRSRPVPLTQAWGSAGAAVPAAAPAAAAARPRSSLPGLPGRPACARTLSSLSSCVSAACSSGGPCTKATRLVVSQASSPVSPADPPDSPAHASRQGPSSAPLTPSKRPSTCPSLLEQLAGAAADEGTPPKRQKRITRRTTKQIDQELQDFLRNDRNVEALFFASSNLLCDGDLLETNIPGQVPAPSATFRRKADAIRREVEEHDAAEAPPPPPPPHSEDRPTPKSTLLKYQETVRGTRRLHSYERDTARVEEKLRVLKGLQLKLAPGSDRVDDTR